MTRAGSGEEGLTVVVYRSRFSLGGPHRWRVVADNGKKVAAGEGYYNKADCLEIVARLFPHLEIKED